MTLSRATVSLVAACDNACIFCGSPPFEGESKLLPSEAIEAALTDARRTHDAVTFVGGEPSLDPRLGEHVARAKSLGFRQVGVQTNGRRLAREGAVAALAEAGLTDVHLSIHGASAAAHDYHTGVEGSFAAAFATLAAASALGLSTVVVTVLTRSNARALSQLPHLLSSRRTSAWLIEVPHARGRADASFDRVIPRLGIAMPFALHAVAAARALSLPTFVRGAPLCVLGHFADRAVVDAPRTFAAVCDQCPARAVCSGLDATYLERFGGDELSWREPPPTLAIDAITSSFVGAGELAERSSRVIPEPPQRARVALPMLPKVQPASREVPRKSDKQTGEALRAIFPALFGDTPKDG